MFRFENISQCFRRIITFFLLVVFFITSGFGPLGLAWSQEVFQLPQPGTRVGLSPAFVPTLLKGIKVYPNDPFRLDFILDKGNSNVPSDKLKDESSRLIKYFLASITVPEKDLWVNLSPYEKDRIVPDAFGQTEMGRDLLSQDYLLKQITASLIYPEGEVGKRFWAKVYAEVAKRYGTTNIPVDTFNKVWIVPEKAVVYENKDAAYVVESRLKVMLETDYFAQEKNVQLLPSCLWRAQRGNGRGEDIAKTILREVVIPILEKEVNEGQNFAQLRQVYNSLILAVWFKDKIRESIFGKAYVDRDKIAGVDIIDKAEKEKIWARYVESFRKGAYNFIREEKDEASGEMIPRKYFSGGLTMALTDRAMHVTRNAGMISGLTALLKVMVLSVALTLGNGPNLAYAQEMPVGRQLASSETVSLTSENPKTQRVLEWLNKQEWVTLSVVSSQQWGQHCKERNLSATLLGHVTFKKDKAIIYILANSGKESIYLPVLLHEILHAYIDHEARHGNYAFLVDEMVSLEKVLIDNGDSRKVFAFYQVLEYLRLEDRTPSKFIVSFLNDAMNIEELSLYEQYFPEVLFDDDLVGSYKFTDKEFAGRSEIDNLVKALQRRGVYIRDGAGIDEINSILQDPKLCQEHYADISPTPGANLIKTNRIVLEKAHKECPRILSNLVAAEKTLKKLEEFKKRAWERLHPGELQPIPVQLKMSGLNTNLLKWRKGRDRKALERVQEGLSLFQWRVLDEVFAYLGEPLPGLKDGDEPVTGIAPQFSRTRKHFAENTRLLGSLPEVRQWRKTLYKDIGIPVEDPSQTVSPDTGGIDLARDRISIKVNSQSESVQHAFDPAMIQRLQDAGGIFPIIIDIRPMTMPLITFLEGKS